MPALLVEDNNAAEIPVEAMTRVIKSGALSMDLDTRAAVASGYPLDLTVKEFAILEILMIRKGMVTTKELIMGHLYGGVDEPDLGIIGVFVCNLRKKLSGLSGGEHIIDTIWGGGYIARDIVHVPDRDDHAVSHKTAA